MLLATVVGTIGYQIDKILALKYLDKSEAGTYILSYSLIFLIIQALGPLYSKYISDKWVEIGLDSKLIFANAAFMKIIILLAYIGAVLNFISIFTIAPYFGYKFHEIREVYDAIWLSIAVIICAINHVCYFDFAAARRYDKIFYQNLSGLVLGSGVAIFAFVQDFSCG